MTPLDRLAELEQFGVKLGLSPIRRIAAALGHPERTAPVVHLAGTNGKGSTAAMIERALRAAGRRTGRYTSPHLSRIEERVAIDGVPIGEADFAEAAAAVLDTIDGLVADGTLEARPTFFEATTAIAFEVFRRAGVDAMVVEVGLGGRFDATNLVEPAVTAITSVDLDHEQHLGATLAAIAFEKAGIAKAGVPLVAGPLAPEARAVVGDVCRAAGAPLVDAADGCVVDARAEGGHQVIAVTTPERRYPATRLALAGRHQAGNALVAIRVLEIAARRGLPVDEDAIVTGLRDAVWPARLEWITTAAGRVLLDAAHNPSGAAALAAYLADTGLAPLPIVIAAMRDKDAVGLVAALAPVASLIVATEAPSPRTRTAADLAADASRGAPGVPVIADPDPDRALARALEGGGPAVLAGSIFLVGPMRARLAGVTP